MTTLNEACSTHAMAMSTKKIEVMVMAKKPEQCSFNSTGQTTIDQTDIITYLGPLITENE